MQNIVNVRIDERLIHGQVAVLWSTHTKATRIMIVDNEVVKDAVNKAALKMVCPQQCKLSILTTQRAADNLKANKYEGERVFIIAKGPHALREIEELGYHFEEINVGNMGGKQNTKTIKKSVACTPEDIEDFLYLAGKGVKLNAKMAPTDSDVDFEALLKEA